MYFGRMIGKMMVRRLFDAPTDGGGGGGAPKPAAQPETFSREYVHELREENKAQRLKAQEKENEAKTAKEEAEKAKTESAAAVAAAGAAASQRIIRAEMKALAVKEGLVDLDDLALIDITGITIEEGGSLKGAEDVLKKFKESKPHKFGEASSSSHQPPPKKGEDTPKKVKDMTPDERKVAAKKLGIRY